MEKIFNIENKYIKAIVLLMLAFPLFIRHLWHKGKVGRVVAIALMVFISFKLYSCTSSKTVSNEEFSITDLSAAYDSGRTRPKTEYIVLHHTAMSSKLKTSILDIATLHMKERGWSSIAYHYLIKDGKIYKLHPDNDITPHTLSYNSSSISICIHGNYSEEQLTDNKQKLVWLIKKLQDEYHIDKTKVVKHGDLNATECCGTNIDMEDLRKCLKSY